MRWVTLLAVVIAGLTSRAGAQTEPFREEITVVRYIVEVRVSDSAGNAIRDLQPQEFVVKIGGKPAEVESASWIGAGENSRDAGDPAAGIPNRDYGRLLVLFVQTDFGRNARRIRGQLHFNAMADRIIALLDPHDYLAVMSYDSNLKLRLDFTRDRDAARKAVREAIRIERLRLPDAAKDGPSLGRFLDHQAMTRATKPEGALYLVAEALHQLKGSKMIFVAGWGLGELRSGKVVLPPIWGEAMNLLKRDRTPVINLGTGVGGQLTVGLTSTAKATGGFYADTYNFFPQQSITRVRGVLAGYYELFIRISGSFDPGTQPMTIRTTRRGAQVYTAPSVTVRSDGPSPEIETARSAPALLQTALKRLHEGETNGVERILTDAIAVDGTFAMAFYVRGMLRVGSGDNEGASADLRRFLELEPNGTHAREARGMLDAMGE